MKITTLANLREYISKKPLIPNTTKVLKAKKTKISKNKFNPKNVFGTPTAVPLNKTELSILLTRKNVMTSANSIHFISALRTLDNM